MNVSIIRPHTKKSSTMAKGLNPKTLPKSDLITTLREVEYPTPSPSSPLRVPMILFFTLGSHKARRSEGDPPDWRRSLRRIGASTIRTGLGFRVLGSAIV